VICGVVSLSGPNGEPLACGWKAGHLPGKPHSWSSLPTWAEGRFISRAEFMRLAPAAMVARLAIWRMLGGRDDDLAAALEERGNELSMVFSPALGIDVRTGLDKPLDAKDGEGSSPKADPMVHVPKDGDEDAPRW
jgi:hypothetical protein